MLLLRPIVLPLHCCALGLWLCASCSQTATPQPSVRPTAQPATAPRARVDTAPDLATPASVGDREESQQQPGTLPDPGTEEFLVAASIVERVRALQASILVFRELPLDGRTEHLRDVYQHELLELGLTFASIRPGDPDQRSYYLARAVSAFEDLAFDSGEDSELGVRAYQHLADLKREAGLQDEAEDFEQALQRLLDERDDGERDDGQ